MMRNLRSLKSLSQKLKPKLTSRDNFTIFGEYIASKLCKLGATATGDEMDSVEFEITSVIEKTRKFSQGKQSHYSNFSFLHSAEVPQQHIHIQTQEVAVQMILVPVS